MSPACNFPFAQQDFSRISLIWLMDWISYWYTRHSLTIITVDIQDFSQIWLLYDWWITCWYTRHSLTIILNGLVYNFKFGIFARYPFFAGKNSLVNQDNFRFFPQTQDIFWFFPQKIRIYSGFFPKIRTFSGFSPKSGHFPVFRPKIRIFSDFSLYMVLTTCWWPCFQQIKQFEM